MPPPATASVERETESDQVPVAAARPWFLMVQVISTCCPESEVSRDGGDQQVGQGDGESPAEDVLVQLAVLAVDILVHRVAGQVADVRLPKTTRWSVSGVGNGFAVPESSGGAARKS